MLPIPERRKAGGPLLGARVEGEAGPYGTRPDDGEQQLDDDGVQAEAELGRDEQLLASVAASSAERAAATRERFRQRREAAQQRREQLWQRRQHGLRQRHAAKLRHLADDDGLDGDGPPEAA